MFNSRDHSEAEIENTAGQICERYLPEVFRYISFWINDRPAAEELTLQAFRKVMGSYSRGFKADDAFYIRVFTAARREMHDYLRTGTGKPVLPDLSLQEQEVISLKMGAVLDNRHISKILGLSESTIERITAESLNQLHAAWQESCSAAREK